MILFAVYTLTIDEFRHNGPKAQTQHFSVIFLSALILYLQLVKRMLLSISILCLEIQSATYTQVRGLVPMRY